MKLNALPSQEALLESVDLLCVPTSRDGMEAVHASLLSKIIPAESLPAAASLLNGKSGNVTLYGAWQGRKLKVLVSYDGEALTEASAYSLCKRMAIRSKSENAISTGVALHFLGNDTIVQAAVTGWVTGQYDLGLFKKAEQDHAKEGADVLTTYLGSANQSSAAEAGVILGLVQHEVMTLVNLPASHKSPEHLSHWAERSAARYHYDCEVLQKDRLTAEGMHALLAVNKGSTQPAHLIITHYSHPDAQRKIAIVGKGVIFDTGGLSIKDSRNMHYMKSDMAGAAAALGTVEACARLKLKVDVMAIAPATDNSVDATATKPGDVISSYAGKTIEVIDTDAEGRLILADALAYAVKQYQPDVLIDMATLTGSIVAALGQQAAGLFTKNDELASTLSTAGVQSGERVWRMPMFDEYHDDMQSDIADIKNLGDKPYAGSITAAKFLEVFTDEHPAWAHLDIAGMAFQPNGFGKSNCATGYGVRLLVKWLTSNPN